MKKREIEISCWLIVFLLIAYCTPVSAKKIIKVACVGNSITYGHGIENREVNAYPAQLQKKLGEEYDVGNFGKSGATLLRKGHRPYIEQNEFRKAMEFAADIVIIHLGINDTDPRDWPNYRDYFISDYLALIDSFQMANPDVRILIAKMTPITDRHPRFESGTRDWHEEIQQAVETIAAYSGTQLINFHEPLYYYPFMLLDAVHPTAEGAKILADIVYSAITGDYGGLHLPEVYSDNMVLQRDIPLEIHGTANANDEVTIAIGKQVKKVRTGMNGQWIIRLSPLKAGGPYTLRVSTGKREIRFQNVLIGEVWLCSGQSNMEFMLKQSLTGANGIAESNNNQLRLFNMQARWRTDAIEWNSTVLDSLNHLQYYKSSQWMTSSPETSPTFSAIAYYFGKMLQDSLQIPVGLICNAVGGSTTESWVGRKNLEDHFPAILKDWTQNDFIQEWVRGRAALNIKKTNNKLQRHPYEPCYLYEAGIIPLEQYPIKGVIWYQGESNAHNFETHEKLFHLLIKSWREQWKNPELPFYYVQLSSIDRPSWPWFRDSQRRLMESIPCTGMAVSSDCGDSLNVHPINKQPVGERLACWALNNTYGMKHVTPSGPVFRGVEFQDSAAYLSFDFAEDMHASDSTDLRTFEIAEIEGLYFSATAEVVGKRIKVYSDKVKKPHYVRYAWQPFTHANLVNSAGLPASTFRSY